jgi:hypothetical protein
MVYLLSFLVPCVARIGSLAAAAVGGVIPHLVVTYLCR